MRCPLDGGVTPALGNDARCGFSVIRARDIDKVGIQGVIDGIRKRVKGTKVYISVDIDVLDPAFAPATGTAEVGGWSTRELLSVIDGLVGVEVVGGDVVEVAPVSCAFSFAFFWGAREVGGALVEGEVGRVCGR
jgi:arginase family enzyme